MSAMDTFDNYLRSLSAAESDAMKEVIHEARQDLFAARSEDARLRCVDDFITTMREKRAQNKRT